MMPDSIFMSAGGRLDLSFFAVERRWLARLLVPAGSDRQSGKVLREVEKVGEEIGEGEQVEGVVVENGEE